MRFDSVLHPRRLFRYYWRAADRKIHEPKIFDAVYRAELCWFGRIVVRIFVFIQSRL